jgi:2-oxoglutarate ferredoxin oxidoreductase subunit alpha
LKDRPLNILIGGEAGQGLATVGEMLAKALGRSGYSLVTTSTYESRVRGGDSTVALRVSTGEIASPSESFDLLVALNPETIRLHRQQLSPGGLILAEEDFEVEAEGCLKIPFKRLAKAKFSNVIALGVVGALLGLKEQSLLRMVEDFFGKKKPELVGENQGALTEAFLWGAKLSPSFHRTLPPISDPPSRLIMNGNQAIALGALSAGMKFSSFYPMSPATSIPLELIKRAKQMGLIVEQAEDEISAINMAIGASFAGAPSMVATSGGGLALMVEAISLAAASETPLVIVVAQRPGPATGLPTRTEQADLEFVLHAGHGEFGRAIFAPGTVEECFHLTRKAFELAEHYQGPIFLLTDQFLADSYHALKPFDLDSSSAVRAGNEAAVGRAAYHRYAVTASGVSPRLLPGKSQHLVIADSHEHTEDGHITEDPSVRKRMVEKRLRKLEGIRAEVIPPQSQGEAQPDLLLISWGSSGGAVSEAASQVRSQGGSVGTLHFSQVWPLLPEQFLSHLERAKKIVCVEGNATGQLASLIHRQSGFKIAKRVLRYDGLPLTPESILRELNWGEK